MSTKKTVFCFTGGSNNCPLLIVFFYAFPKGRRIIMIFGIVVIWTKCYSSVIPTCVLGIKGGGEGEEGGGIKGGGEGE